MAFSVIVIIVLLGIILVLLEIFIVPGTTVVGIAGGVLMVAGVVLAYVTQQNVWLGHGTLAGTLVATVVLGYLATNMFDNSSLTLRDSVEGQVNMREGVELQVGDEGITVSDLRPGGKALFNDVKFEVFSQGDFVDAGTAVRIIKLTSNKVLVKPV